jgi:hypothetical protein
MLRQKVLQKWNNYKQKFLTHKKNQLTKSEIEFFDLLATELFGIPPLKKDIETVNIAGLKYRMISLDKDFNKVQQKYLSMNFSDLEDSPSRSLDLTYMAYSGLLTMYQNFVEALDHSNPGPIIEEVK